jgi:hypothetical protein
METAKIGGAVLDATRVYTVAETTWEKKTHGALAAGEE